MAGFTIRLDWQDDEEGGTPVFAADVLRWERGIADALAREFTLSAGQVKLADLNTDLTGRLAPSGSLVQLDDAQGWAFAIYYAGTREVAFGIRTDGTVYPPLSEVKAGSIGLAALASEVSTRLAPEGLTQLTDDQGWAFAVYFAGTREVAFGVRNDGTVYPPPPVVLDPCVIRGDSLAQGWGGLAATLLAGAIQRPVLVDGFGGQRAAQVAARHGGAPALLTFAGNMMPGDTSSVAVTSTVDLLAPTGTGFNTRGGSVMGVKGTLTGGKASGTVNTYSWARTEPGGAMPVPPGTPFSTGIETLGHVPILIQGRNDVGSGGVNGFRTPLADILASIESELRFTRHRARALVVLPLPNAATERNRPADRSHAYDVLCDAMRTTFPAQALDWYAYLTSDAAFAAAGLTKTAQDIQDIADGVMPVSFTADGLHPNADALRASVPFFAAVIKSRE